MIKLNYNSKIITVIVHGMQVELGEKIHNILILGKRDCDRLISPNKNIRDKSSYEQISGHNLAYSIFTMKEMDECIQNLDELINAHKKGNIIKPILCYIKTIDIKDNSDDEIFQVQLKKFISLLREMVILSREANSQIHLFILDESKSLSSLRYDFDYYVEINN